jgi:hypothetical protein
MILSSLVIFPKFLDYSFIWKVQPRVKRVDTSFPHLFELSPLLSVVFPSGIYCSTLLYFHNTVFLIKYVCAYLKQVIRLVISPNTLLKCI